MSKEKKKKLTLKNFKGTPRKFNDNNLKTKGKVVVERKNSTFKSNKPIIMSTRVVFPHPVEPIIPIFEPAAMFIEISLRT